MDQEKRQAVALMRYSAIAPLITGLSDDFESLTAFFNHASIKGVTHPDGTVKHYAPGTIEKWYRNYKEDGFDALIPTGRRDQGKPRKLDEDLQEQIKYLKSNYPRMSASAIYRQLRDNGSIKNGEVSESTVNRYINLIAIQMKTTTNHDMRRYERAHINEVWCGDSSVGPYLKTTDGKKHKVYIIALIDDASRFIVGIDVFFNDNFVNLISIFLPSIVPQPFELPPLYQNDREDFHRHHIHSFHQNLLPDIRCSPAGRLNLPALHCDNLLTSCTSVPDFTACFQSCISHMNMHIMVICISYKSQLVR